MLEIKGKKTHTNQLDVDSAETAEEAINDDYAFTVWDYNSNNIYR
jgi:hypothetical protein